MEEAGLPERLPGHTSPWSCQAPGPPFPCLPVPPVSLPTAAWCGRRLLRGKWPHKAIGPGWGGRGSGGFN